MSTDDRLEHYCRLGLLAVAILHWIVFILMVGTSEASTSNQAPPENSNLARIVLPLR